MFEDSEFKDPYDALRSAGHEVTIVGLEAGEVLEGSKGKVKAKVDKSFKDVKPNDFDALLIPGGSSPDKLRAHDEAVQFVKAFMTARKPVFAICHGPQLLLTADEYKGHRMTAWKTVLGDLQKAAPAASTQKVAVATTWSPPPFPLNSPESSRDRRTVWD